MAINKETRKMKNINRLYKILSLVAVLNLSMAACGEGMYHYDYDEVRIATVDEWETRFGPLSEACEEIIWKVREVGVEKIDTCGNKGGGFAGCAHTKSDYFDAVNTVPACMRAKTTAHELEHFLSRCTWGPPTGDHNEPGLWERNDGNDSIEITVWHNVGCPDY